MLSLTELQEKVRASVTQRSAPALDAIVEGPRVSAQDRLKIYTEAYLLRLIDSLGSDFPATRRALGADLFGSLAKDYLTKHPSTSPNISDAGFYLADFSQTHRVSKLLPYTRDLICLEWAILESLYSDRLPAINAAKLQGVPETAWTSAQLLLDPTVHLIQADWAVDKLWEKRRAPELQHRPQLKQKKSRWLLLYRDTTWVQLKVLDEPRWKMLQLLKEGAALGAACEVLEKSFPDQKLAVMEWFSHWIGAGVIKNVRI